MKRLAFALLLTSVAAGSAPAQTQEAKFPMYLDTGTGHLKYRSHTYMSITAPENPQVLFVPGPGLTGEIFQTRADGTPGWQDLANERNWNTYSLTLVGCGKTDPTPTDDLALLSEFAVYGIAQMGVGSDSQLVIASGVNAAYAIKGRANHRNAYETAVLIDAWGPRGSQSRPIPSVEEVMGWKERREDRLFHEWGLGPKPGTFSQDSDLGPAGFAAMLERYEDDQPAYWASVLTGFDGKTGVADGKNLKDWPVLLVQGPHRTADEVQWEDDLAAWLTGHGALVERVKLTDLGLPGVSSLPMSGRHAAEVLDTFLEWSLTQPLAAEADRQRSHGE